MKQNIKWYYDVDWIREWQHDNIDWFEISEHLPEMDINFCREFKDKIKWLWALYAHDIEKRPDIIEEFELDNFIEKYGDPN